MLGLIIGLLVLWVILAIVGITVKALFWLLWVAVILFIITLIVGYIRRNAGTRGRTGRHL